MWYEDHTVPCNRVALLSHSETDTTTPAKYVVQLIVRRWMTAKHRVIAGLQCEEIRHQPIRTGRLLVDEKTGRENTLESGWRKGHYVRR